jgi:hypothetical protein
LKPTYLLEVWMMRGGEVTFSPITDRTIGECRDWFEYHKMFNGKTATVFCFFSDYDLRDEQLLEAATRFMKGNYKLISWDLNTSERTISDGVDLTNPRQ